MKLGINPFYFKNAGVGEQPRTEKECIDLVKAAGFSKLDVSTADRSTAEEMAGYIMERGMEVIQSHLPFNRYGKANMEQHAETQMRYAENARIMGSKILVAHGDEFDFDNMTYTPEAALEYNYALFSPIVEFAAANGMKVAFENVFQDLDPVKRPRNCSLVEELCALVDRFGTDTVGICWDSGHAKVQYGEENLAALSVAGSRVIATHIHDNYYKRDLHLFPFMGQLDWVGFMKMLRQIGYQGNLSFEIGYNMIPKALAAEYLALLHKSGEYLLSL